jgi:hypothetical protein
MEKIYYEPQRGGLCRLHSINGFYQKQYITTKQFNRICKCYNKEYPGVDCTKYDQVPSDHVTLTAYILDLLSNIKVELIPIGNLQNVLEERWMWKMGIQEPPRTIKLPLEEFIGESKWIFIFNADHIWGAIKVKGMWHTVDSIRGVRSVDLNSMNNEKLGFMIPRTRNDIMESLRFHQSKIKNFYRKCPSSTDFIKFINDNLSSTGESFGPVETNVGIFCGLSSTEIFPEAERIKDLWKIFIGMSLSDTTNDPSANDTILSNFHFIILLIDKVSLLYK